MNRCAECGELIPEGETFCSDDCYDLWMYEDDGLALPPSKPVILPPIDFDAIPF